MTLAPVTDLKNIQPVSHRSGDIGKEMTYVHWQADIFTGHGLHAPAHLSTLCYPLSREQQRSNFYLSRPISLHGLCSTDISGESPRYRSMSSSTTTETVSHGYSRHSRKVKSCRCKRTKRLAYICRSRPFLDHLGSCSIQQRTIWSRFAANSIRTGCNYDRPVFIDVSLGQLPTDQVSNKAAYPAGSQGQYSYFYQHHRWESARCERPRRASHRTRSFLHNGSRLSGLCQTSQYLESSRIFCNPIKVQFQMPQNLFSFRRSINRPPVRSNNYAYRVLFAQGLSRQTSPRQILRCRNRENFGIFDQQFHPASIDHCTAVSLPLAGRAFLQMDKTKSAHQKFLRYFGERCKNSNLDCRISLRAGCHTQKTAQHTSESLHNFTNSQRLGFRENTVITTTYRSSTGNGNLRIPKPVEFIHLTVGH